MNKEQVEFGIGMPGSGEIYGGDFSHRVHHARRVREWVEKRFRAATG